MKPTTMILTASTLLLLTAVAAAENISVTPPSWDFSLVDVGDSLAHDFEILSVGPTPLTVHSITFEEPTSPFSVTSVVLNRVYHPASPEELPWPIPAQVLLPTDFLDVEVTYAPTTIGDHFTNLHISGGATSPDNELDVALSGRGGPASVIPEPGAVVIWSLLGVVGAACGWRRRRRS